MITATARQHVLPGKEAELLAIMKELTGQVKANEPGCTIFEFVRSKDEEGVFLVIEQYADHAAFDVHLAQPYLQDCLPRLFACLQGPPELATYLDV